MEYLNLKKKTKDFIDSLVTERLRELHTLKGIEYLVNKYPKDKTIEECIDKEIVSIYDEISCECYLYTVGRIVEINSKYML